MKVAVAAYAPGLMLRLFRLVNSCVLSLRARFDPFFQIGASQPFVLARIFSETVSQFSGCALTIMQTL
ncbi:hypothetical protein CEV31_2733 [Brucella thiophenivorans]|uniref:Uncharacterized protein n=1 Tax=Brucella thiophenivorans TaxID=571255 RepID=A0A256FN67_9HYPH|nr:hypothetical protein CEV31_2733 [Brucella thiophenivorans]